MTTSNIITIPHAAALRRALKPPKPAHLQQLRDAVRNGAITGVITQRAILVDRNEALAYDPPDGRAGNGWPKGKPRGKAEKQTKKEKRK